MKGVLGKKLGMTQIYSAKGQRIGITLIETVPAEVMAVKNKKKHGYSAIQLGLYDKKKKGKNTSRKKFIKEIRFFEDQSCHVGDQIKIDIFQEGEYVDVTGTSKGKGFQGGVKRWGWKGGEASHGSMFKRRVGSIGASSYPSRVHKGKTMPGHMGNEKKTIQSMKVVMVDAEKNLIAVSGPVPGHINGYLVIREAKKRPTKIEKAEKKDGAK